MSALLPSSTDWQAGFLQVIPTVEQRAKIRFRRLPAVHREEAIQESIAFACVSYQHLASQNRLDEVHASTIANYAVKRTGEGRHVGGKKDTRRDAMSPIALRRHGIKVMSYDSDESGRAGGGWKSLVIVDRKTDVPNLACFRVDFSEWLKTLARRDRKIIAALTGGAGTCEIAGRFGMSPGRVSQLRRKYEHHWPTFQGEAA
jgi:hypothetical protein